MKTFTATALFAALAVLPALAQPGTPLPGPASGVGVCLRPFNSPSDPLNHTKVVDPQHILFYMNDGKVWLNTLKGPCPGLMFHGFSFLTRQDEICGNSTPIQVVESGQTCSLGPFTAYAETPHGYGR